MATPIKRKVKINQAEYVKETDSILILGECKEGKLRHQIHRSCFSFGNRNEEMIIKELKLTAKMMIGKTITMVFDPDLKDKMNNNVAIHY
jgi:hypothetical protein